jgi:hypothetical protein
MTHISQAIHPRAVYKDLFRVPAITAYNRLEARPRTVDFSRSLRAEVRDALWLLTRQWQMGEFQAEDAASPIDARLATRLARFDRVSFAGGPPQPYDESVPLEVAVEREDFPWTLPARIEAGQRFLGLLAPAVRAAVLAPARAAFALEADPDWSKQADTLALYRVAAARAIDGARLLASHAAGTLAATLGAAPADVTDAADAVAAWRRRVFGAPQGTGGRAWIPDRLAYDVRIATPLADGEQALLTARRYAEGRLDWYAFDAGATGERLPAPAGAPPPAAARADTLSFVPTAAAFPGMPNPRFWEMEDRRVNFGALNAKTTDHLLLAFAEMGLVYGNDWFVIPYEMPVNHLCQVLGLLVTDVFGDRTLVPPANGTDETSWQRWSMFSVAGESQDDWRGRYMWLPATLAAVDQGEPIESVSFARDEMANLAWAVEDTVPDGTGRGIETRLLVPASSAPLPPPAAVLRYTLGTTVPENWVPFVPVHLPGSVQDIRFQRGEMPPQGTPPVAPRRRGVLVNEFPAPFYVAEEEVPQSGIIVTRRVQRARWHDGRTYLWIGRARETGRGGAESGLAFDQAGETTPR